MDPEHIINSRNQSEWQEHDSHLTQDDPLLGCLTVLSKILSKPHSPESLVAGLPLVDNKLTPKLFPRAAERAGLSSKIVKRRLSKISNLVLPAIILLDDTNACILLSIESNQATVIFPETGEGESTIKLEELEAIYTGFSIFIKSVHQFDKRTESSAIPRASNWFWGTISRFWPVYSQVFIASILVNSFALASPLFVMNVYDRVVPNQAIETLWVLAIGVATVFVFDLLLRTLRAYFIDVASKKADIILSATIFEKVLGVKMASRSNSVGSFANSMQEFESFREFFTSATLTTLVDLPFAFLFIAVIWFVAGPLAYVPLAVIPLTILVSLAIQIPLAKNVKLLFRHSAQRSSTLIETLTGLETIKSIGAESPLQRKWEQTIGFMTKYSQKTRILSTTAINFTAFLQQMASITVVVFGVYLITENEITMGALIASTLLTGRALAPMAQLAGLLTRYHQSRAALQSLNSLMSLPVERPSGREFLHRPAFNGGVEFKKVTFRYPEQPIDALKDVSFKIEAGEKVAFIGRIGSGKSTIEKLILGLYEPEDGAILLDGTDIRQIDPVDLRKNVGEIYNFGARLYGKTLISLRIDIALSSLYEKGLKSVCWSIDSRRLLGVLGRVEQAMKYHPIFKPFKFECRYKPEIKFYSNKNYWECKGVNITLEGKAPGAQWYQIHVDKMWGDEVSFETETVFKKRRDSVGELGTIHRQAGMTNFTKHSPAGKAFYNAKNRDKVMNLPRYANPYWNEEKLEEALLEFGGKESLNFKIFVGGEIIEDGISVLDMDRVI
ncbi:hypothetical protein LCGC14_1295770, partial [marine sediment metagenome]